MTGQDALPLPETNQPNNRKRCSMKRLSGFGQARS